MTLKASPMIQVPNGSERSSLKVLVIDEWPPIPANSGKRIRTWSLLERLAKRHRISMLCYSDHESELCVLMRAAGITLHAARPFKERRGFSLYCDLLANIFSRFPYSVWKHYTTHFEGALRALLEGEPFDLVHCEWTPYARFLDALVKTPKLIMAHNIESQILLRRARTSRTLVERIFFNEQARKMESFERQAFARADWVATVTEQDADCARSWGVRRVSVVENGVDLKHFAPADEAPSDNEVLFLASLDWYPNLDALNYLLDDILPLIQKLRPGTTLRIVGRRPSPEIRDRIAGRPNVELVGEVADVRPYLARAAVVVVPLRIGGGSRIKILEALAMGKAVVSTAIGAEGLAVLDGVHLLLADSPADFAQRTIELLNSPEKRARLGEKGRKLVEERYSWDYAAEALEAAWYRLSDTQAVTAHPTAAERKEAQVRL